MTDTQWPRFMVFEQLKADQPHQHAGTVHAPDSEMALLNARDVFVRRPETFSQWVVRADYIYSRTAQELAGEALEADLVKSKERAMETYYVFQKRQQKRPVQYVGEVDAPSASHALQIALTTYGHPEALMWWIVPAAKVHKSDPADNESAFEPAGQKYYRHQIQFSNDMLLRKMTRDWRKQQNFDDE